MADLQVKEAFVRIAELAGALGVENIGTLPACWEHQVDKRWWIAVNAHKEEIKDSHGATVPSFCAVIEYNGWPAGIIGPGEGIIAAGSMANEDTFIAALLAATDKAKALR